MLVPLRHLDAAVICVGDARYRFPLPKEEDSVETTAV